jgi:hypothetical protein
MIKRNSFEKEKVDYLDDYQLTTLLMKEMNSFSEQDLDDFKTKKRHPVPSDELTEAYLTIMYSILRKPNFSGYYEEVREAIISKCQIIFLNNWYKFKPYRVRNNFKIDRTESIVSDSIEKGTDTIFTKKPLNKYALIMMFNRSFTVKSCEKIEEDRYKVTFFNKLKHPINEETSCQILYPKVDFDNLEDNVLSGAFSFLSLFTFTGAKDEITAYKKRKEKMKHYLETKESEAKVHSNVFIEEFI